MINILKTAAATFLSVLLFALLAAFLVPAGTADAYSYYTPQNYSYNNSGYYGNNNYWNNSNYWNNNSYWNNNWQNGYWHNGVWYPTVSSRYYNYSNTYNSSNGYWYNGVWYSYSNQNYSYNTYPYYSNYNTYPYYGNYSYYNNWQYPYYNY